MGNAIYATTFIYLIGDQKVIKPIKTTAFRRPPRYCSASSTLAPYIGLNENIEPTHYTYSRILYNVVWLWYGQNVLKPSRNELFQNFSAIHNAQIFLK